MEKKNILKSVRKRNLYEEDKINEGNLIKPNKIDIYKIKKNNNKEEQDESDEMDEESNVKYYEWNE